MKKKLLLFFVLLSVVILSSCASHAYCPAYADSSTRDMQEVSG